MKNELLLLGGSHMAQIISYAQSRSNAAIGAPKNFEIKSVCCSDLDFSATFDVTPERALDCRGHAYLARSCQQTYGGHLIPYIPNRIICVLIGNWHHVVDDPIWTTRYPAELLPGVEQSVPVSVNEIIERIWPEVYIRVKVMAALLRGGQRFFAAFTPYIPLFQATKMGVPPRTVQYLHGLCHVLYKNALTSLGIKYVSNPQSFISPDGFLKPELCTYNNSHANDKYVGLYWDQIRFYLDQHEWRPDNFDYDLAV